MKLPSKWYQEYINKHTGEGGKFSNKYLPLLDDSDKQYLDLPHDKILNDLQIAFGSQHYKIRNHYYCNDICEHPLLQNLMPFYKRVLCVTLQKAVEDNLSAPVTTQLSLLEELAIIREIACEPLADYSEIVEKLEGLQKLLSECNNNEHKETLIKAIETAKLIKANNSDKTIAALHTVKEFCEKAARIDALCRDKFSIHTLHSVVAQITAIISKKLHDNNLDHVAVEVNDAIQNELVMPLPETATNGGNGDVSNNGNAGVKLTPDMVIEDLLEMDKMVPDSLIGGDE